MEGLSSAGKHGFLPTTAVLSWLRLARVFQRVEQLSADHLKRWTLSGAQFDVLVQVGRAEGITQQDLASALLVTKGNICQLLDRMERDGLVRRVPYGRSNRLFLTETGSRTYFEALPAQEAAIDGMLSSLTKRDQLQLLRLLGKLDRSLRAASKHEEMTHDDSGRTAN